MTFNTRIKLNINEWVFVCLCKTKIWWNQNYYMNTQSFIVYLKTDDIYKDIAKYVETRFDTSNFELDRPLPKGKNKKVIGLINDELGGKIMTKFFV